MTKSYIVNPFMSPAQVFKVYIWLVDTISSGRLTKEDIDRRWSHSSINVYGEPFFPTRKFHRYKEEILTLFGINIRCNRKSDGILCHGDRRVSGKSIKTNESCF